MLAVIFTHAELWMLLSFIKPATRHIGFESEGAQAMPGSTRLNDEIADALVACEDSGLSEYALELTRDDLLLISYLIDASCKTPEGASGKQILLKTFRARQENAGLILSVESDMAYNEATRKENSDANDITSEDSSTITNEKPPPKRGARKTRT